MKAFELKKDLYWAGILDSDLRVFDIIMYTEFGTTYNSYVLKGSEKTALIETAKEKFFDEYRGRVESVTDFSSVDYIIVDHTEPDHAGSIERILEINPSIEIVGTAGAIGFLKHIVNRDFYSIIVKENDTLSLGGKTLRFMMLPNLHWPDTMYTYLEEDRVLFTCDSFGSHYSHPELLRSKVTDTEGYLRATKYYFDNILGPFKQPYMTKALRRIDGLPIDMICTGHGPVLDSHIDELFALYEEWCKGEAPNPRKTVVIPYVSAYGFTKTLAERIAAGIRDSGDVEVRLYDLVEADASLVLGEIGRADGILFGTPTILNEALKPIWDLTTAMYPPIHGGKYASAFGSYGWSGEGVGHITERLKQLKLKVLEGFRVRFKPSKTELIEAYEFGYNFGCVVQNKENDKKKKPSGLVKCLVCGEVFSADQKVCPVCGVGPENFVPVDDAEPTFRRDTEERFLILGGGAAAVNAAEAIRARNKTCHIVLLSHEEALPYNRPMLTKSMFAPMDNGQIAMHGEAWYQANGITLLPGKTISAVDPANKTVSLPDGAQFAFDKLIYALGARPFVPPIPGASLPGVHTVRSLSDVSAIRAQLPSVRNAVVIGGGVIGLEAAWELKKEKCGVTVLEAAPLLLAGKTDRTASEMLRQIAAEAGVEVRCGVAVDSITGRDRAEAVRLKDGTELEADLVLVSCGIRANAEIAKEAGLACERGVLVDARMATSDRSVFACGDCAQLCGKCFGLWSEAMETGRVAGANAAGEELSYAAPAPALSMNAYRTAFYAVGDVGNVPDKKYKTVEFRDDQKHTLEKYFFVNNRLSGGILIGDTGKLVTLTEAVEQNKLFKDMF